MLKPDLPQITPEARALSIHLLSYFQIDGRKANEVATEGQILIFYSIIFEPSQLIQIITCTQYGKSLFVALACIICSCIKGELIPIVAPKKEQAKLIMRYYIEHLSDNPLFYSQLQKNTRLDRLKQEESKERIVLRNGGGVFALSVDAGSTKGIEAAMGQGGRKPILDEAGLIGNEHESTIFRMMAGKGKNFCYVKIGNPFYCNHFKESWEDRDYYKIFVDRNQALKEGRYTEAFIEKAMKKPLAGILYDCEFPDESEIDIHGFRVLFTSDERARVFTETKPELKKGWKKLGVDIARGGDWVSFTIRDHKAAYVKKKYKTRDLMAIVGDIIQVVKEEKIDWDEVYVDDTGMGGGVTDRLAEQEYYVNACHEGGGAEDKETYLNAKAEANFRVKEWLLELGGRFYGKEYEVIKEIKWKINSSGKIQMESKDDLRKRGIPSPDDWDSACLTFYEKTAQRPSIRRL
jgi:hypothetical protein